MKIPYTWGNADFTWNDNDFIWQDVYYILEELKKQGGGIESVPTLSKEKHKKLIKVILTLKNIDYEVKKTEFKKYKVTIEDLKMVEKEIQLQIIKGSINVS